MHPGTTKSEKSIFSFKVKVKVTMSLTIGLELGPSTALYRSFLKHCTLTNKAVWATSIWRALSKPPQRRQGPDLRPLWLLVATPSAFGPELAYSLRVAQSTLMDVPRYFFYIFLYMFVYHILWPIFGWLFVFSLYKEDYLQNLNACPFDYTAVVVIGKVGIPLTGLTTPVWWLSLPELTAIVV